MKPVDDSEWRGRVERKLDAISEAVVRLARVEERTATLFRDQSSNTSAVVNLTARLTALEATTQSNKTSIRVAERVFWFAATLATPIISGVAVYYLTKGS
ncbi:hypothetical protein KX928_17390 [Roseobacter sp. YSTF-M11]|uniref:Uncharacterized protein n=1 Tax=Roseobacter insulae TaxID=2859783 RepID=A0A9X1FXP7_9RHOB|nr:hypothetical protein [Roseobacter insulae]MBW4709563.1 hypothetical protein [Roseobacter insulae]